MLTENQQHLINQITEEFISHNQSKVVSRSTSLLGVDDIIDSVQGKRDEIARIKKHNEAVFKSMRPIFSENYDALHHEINALGLDLQITSDWFEAQDGKLGITMRVSICYDRRSDADFYFDARITGDYLKWKGQVTWNVVELNPVLVYTYRSNNYTFEQLCKNPDFIGTIKRMYEIKTK